MLTNPYQNIDRTHPQTDLLRLSTTVLRADIQQIYSVCPITGIAQDAVNKFIYYLSHECKRRQWTLANSGDLIALINHITNLDNRPVTTDEYRVVEKTADGDVGRRTDPVGPTPEVNSSSEHSRTRPKTSKKIVGDKGTKTVVGGEK